MRKAACVRLADAGCDVFEIMAITGHTDVNDVQAYVAAANKKKQAQSAIAKQYGAARERSRNRNLLAVQPG